MIVCLLLFEMLGIVSLTILQYPFGNSSQMGTSCTYLGTQIPILTMKPLKWDSSAGAFRDSKLVGSFYSGNVCGLALFADAAAFSEWLSITMAVEVGTSRRFMPC